MYVIYAIHDVSVLIVGMILVTCHKALVYDLMISRACRVQTGENHTLGGSEHSGRGYSASRRS